MPVSSTAPHTEIGYDSTARAGLVGELTSIWPSIPFMAFGVWIAWSLLTYSGSLWLSDNETNGEWLSNLFSASTLSFAAVLIVAAVRAQLGRRSYVLDNRVIALAGGVAAVGCLLIILAGPYYLSVFLGDARPLFFLGAVLSGLGTGVIGLRCGVLFGMLPPRRALVYAALSQLLCSFIYFSAFALPQWAPVEHGPSLASIVLFCLLPVAAAGVVCIPVPVQSGALPESLDFDCDVRKLPGAFARFLVFSLLLSFIVSAIRSAVVTTHSLAATVEGNNALTVLRVAMALAFILYGVRASTHGVSLGKICSLVAVFSAIVLALAAALGGIDNAWSIVISFASSVFDFIMWCLLAFVVAQKRVSAVVVFGFGRGAFVAGGGLGWLAGSHIMPYVVQSPYATVVYIAMAGIMLLLAVGLFSERDFERLFSPVSEDELTLADLFDIEGRETAAQEPAGQRSQKRGRFSRAIEKMTEEYSLSARESDVLRCLAMGYGSERIAETLGIKVNTARAHTHNVYVKLEVHSREDLMLLVDDEVAAL